MIGFGAYKKTRVDNNNGTTERRNNQSDQFHPDNHNLHDRRKGPAFLDQSQPEQSCCTTDCPSNRTDPAPIAESDSPDRWNGFDSGGCHYPATSRTKLGSQAVGRPLS